MNIQMRQNRFVLSKKLEQAFLYKPPTGRRWFWRRLVRLCATSVFWPGELRIEFITWSAYDPELAPAISDRFQEYLNTVDFVTIFDDIKARAISPEAVEQEMHRAYVAQRDTWKLNHFHHLG